MQNREFDNAIGFVPHHFPEIDFTLHYPGDWQVGQISTGDKRALLYSSDKPLSDMGDIDTGIRVAVLRIIDPLEGGIDCENFARRLPEMYGKLVPTSETVVQEEGMLITSQQTFEKRKCEERQISPEISELNYLPYELYIVKLSISTLTNTLYAAEFVCPEDQPEKLEIGKQILERMQINPYV